MTKSEFSAKVMAPLPDELMNKRPPVFRGVFNTIVGWLLLDWFTTVVKFEPFMHDGQTMFRVVVKRWGENFTFNTSMGGLIGIAHTFKKQDMARLSSGWTITSPVLGVITVPSWAWHKFLVEFAHILHVVTEELNEMTAKLPDDSATIH